jgi:multiple sugar transport system permease protein
MSKNAISLEHDTGRNSRGTRRQPRWTLPLGLIVPSLLVIALVNLYPFVNGLYLSLTNSSLLGTGSFVGLDSFRSVVSNIEFDGALRFTLIFAVCAVFGSYIVGLLLALLLNGEVWGRGFFRAGLLIPWIIPPIVSIVSWRWMLDQGGLINAVLGDFGIAPIFFLSSTFWAPLAVIIVKIWVSFPFMMVTCLAGLQSIPQELYEAVAIDGGGPLAAFRAITLPHLRMLSIISWLLMTIWSVNDFTTIWLLTQGGPVDSSENLIVLAFKYAFQVGSVGLGAAVAIIMMLIMLAVGIVLLWVMARQEEAA